MEKNSSLSKDRELQESMGFVRTSGSTGEGALIVMKEDGFEIIVSEITEKKQYRAKKNNAHIKASIEQNIYDFSFDPIDDKIIKYTKNLAELYNISFSDAFEVVKYLKSEKFFKNIKDLTL